LRKGYWIALRIYKSRAERTPYPRPTSRTLPDPRWWRPPIHEALTEGGPSFLVPLACPQSCLRFHCTPAGCCGIM